MNTSGLLRDIQKICDDKKMAPVDPSILVDEAQICVYHADFEFTGICGIVKKDRRGTAFYLRQDEEKMVQRFMLAHMFAHYFLHLQNLKLARIYCQYHHPFDKISERESEADAFALQLLMPEKAMKALEKSHCSAEKIATIFQVPVQNAATRLNQFECKEVSN